MSSILLQFPKNPKVEPYWGTLSHFLTFKVAKCQKLRERPFDDFFAEKNSQCRKKTERGDPLVSPVLYVH